MKTRVKTWNRRAGYGVALILASLMSGCPAVTIPSNQSPIEDSGDQAQPIPAEVQTTQIPVQIDGAGSVEQTISGAIVTLTAVPAQGWTFEHWSGSTSSTLNPLTILPGADAAFTAHFSMIPLLDGDLDGIPDAEDRCAGFDDANDADGDGVPDECDSCRDDPTNDADGDGICGNEDNCPSTRNADQTDSDGDGLGDACDPCPTDPRNDRDADGVCDDTDNCVGIANPSQVDTDDDGSGDACDSCPNDPDDDQDSDGVCGDIDNCPEASNAGQEDGDSDGIGDGCDDCPEDPLNDADSDGICDGIDNCIGFANANQTDTDGDGTGDDCDACPNDGDNDKDADGVCGDLDNCPDTANASQSDADADGVGDACDACPNDADNDADDDGLCGDVDACPFDPANDSDGDGICGDDDNCPTEPNDQQTDADEDGLGDECDACPNDAANDADADGICGDVDACPNDPANDADGDGVCGDVDACPGFDDRLDEDLDGIPDACDSCPSDPMNDQDADGVCGDEDNCPDDANGLQSDMDGDTVGDICDLCPETADGREVDINGCPIPICGDGLVEFPEECDSPDETICLADCRLPEIVSTWSISPGNISPGTNVRDDFHFAANGRLLAAEHHDDYLDFAAASDAQIASIETYIPVGVETEVVRLINVDGDPNVEISLSFRFIAAKFETASSAVEFRFEYDLIFRRIIDGVIDEQDSQTTKFVGQQTGNLSANGMQVLWDSVSGFLLPMGDPSVEPQFVRCDGFLGPVGISLDGWEFWSMAPMVKREGPTCGNGIVERGEDCEPPGSPTCDETCRDPSAAKPTEWLASESMKDPIGLFNMHFQLRTPELYELHPNGKLGYAFLDPSALSAPALAECRAGHPIIPHEWFLMMTVIQVQPPNILVGWEIERIRINKFELHIAGDTATWDFDFTMTREVLDINPLELERRFTTSVTGQKTGVVSPDGSLITWESITGEYVACFGESFGCDPPVDLSGFYSLGTWTKQ